MYLLNKITLRVWKKTVDSLNFKMKKKKPSFVIQAYFLKP